MATKFGIRPLSYTGVKAKNPPNMTIKKRNPTTKDCKGFELGALWVYPTVNRIFILTDKSLGVATWLTIQTAGGGDDLQGMITDDANTTVGDVSGNITVSGGSNIDTYQIGPYEYGIKTVANAVFGVSVTSPLISGAAVTGGILTGLNMFGGVVQTNAVGVLSSSRGNDGEVLIGNTGANATWNTLTEGAGIDINNAAGVVTISTGGLGSAADGAVLIGSATGDPAWNNITAGTGVNIINTPNGVEVETTNDLPVGIIMEDPNGATGSWLDCDGSIVLQATYPELYAKIGQNYAIPKFVSTEIVRPAIIPATASASLKFISNNKLASPNNLWLRVWNWSKTLTSNGNTITSEPVVEISTDCVTWTHSSITWPTINVVRTPEKAVHNGLEGADGLWILFIQTGTTNSDAVFKPIVYVLRSTDGVTWTTSAALAITDFRLKAEPFWNGLPVGAGGKWIAGTIESTDGVTWTEININQDKIVAVINNRYLARGAQGGHSFSLSRDEIDSPTISMSESYDWYCTWDNTDKSSFSSDNLTYGNNGILYTTMWHSDFPNISLVESKNNGYSWEQSYKGLPISGYACSGVLIFVNNKYFFFADLSYTQSKPFISYDAKNWTEADLDIFDLYTSNNGLSENSRISDNNGLTGSDFKIAYRTDKYFYNPKSPGKYYISASENAFNTATHFQLPNIPGSIILY